ncbi:MAG: hypothetical protein LCH98_18010 [Actinobacteria bacterium]|nr:hypothetical protein [Actinomycetota bacterium]
MSSDEAPTPEDTSRAELLPEEIAAGSDDPIGQAEAILAESLERTQNPEAEIRRTAEDATGGSVDPR